MTAPLNSSHSIRAYNGVNNAPMSKYCAVLTLPSGPPMAMRRLAAANSANKSIEIFATVKSAVEPHKYGLTNMYSGRDKATARYVAVTEVYPYFLTNTIKKPKPTISMTKMWIDFSYMNSFSATVIPPSCPYLFSWGINAMPITIEIAKKNAAHFVMLFLAESAIVAPLNVQLFLYWLSNSI